MGLQLTYKLVKDHHCGQILIYGKKSATASTQRCAHPHSNIATTEGLFGLRWHNMPREGERGKEKKVAQIRRHFNTFQCDFDNQLYCTSLANGRGHLLTYTCLLVTNILAYQNLLFVIRVKLEVTKPTVNRTSASVLAHWLWQTLGIFNFSPGHRQAS